MTMHTPKNNTWHAQCDKIQYFNNMMTYNDFQNILYANHLNGFLGILNYTSALMQICIKIMKLYQ